MAHLRWLIKVFPAIELLGFCVPCQKWTLKSLSKIPPCVRKGHQAVWKGSFLLQMQRRQKPNKRNRPGEKKKKRKLKNQEETRTRRRERSDKGANKETARKTGKHFQNQWDWGWKESRSEETLGCRRCMWLWGKKTGIVSWWWEHHTVQAETETYLGGGGEAGDKCCLETGKED